MLLVGLALGLIIVPVTMAIMSTVDPTDAGAGSGVLQTTMMTGSALGMRHGFVAGTVFAVLALLITLVSFPTGDRPR
jgi:hypothetical protein